MVMMGDTPVRQPLPTMKVEQIDPFLLLHHHTTEIEAGTRENDAGVGPHPHRGFSPVTFIYQGSLHHRDSRGNSSVVRAGGVQWTDVGMGIVHSERPDIDLVTNGGTMEIIQLWVNTPQKHKMDQPLYQPFGESQLPALTPDKGEANIRLVAGEQDGQKGPVQTKLPVLSLMGEFKAGAAKNIEVPAGMHSFMYLLSGSVRVHGHGLVEEHNMVVFEEGTEPIGIDATAATRFLFMAGMPLKEPLATYGPFVMNTQSEIMEAMRDYQMGRMGFLVEEFEGATSES